MTKKVSEKFFRDQKHEWVKASNFVPISAPELIQRVEKNRALRLTEPGAPWAWILDLDSTLFCVSDRIKSIFLEFLRNHPKPETHWHWILDRWNSEVHLYGIEATFKHLFKHHNSQMADIWAHKLWTEFQDFWNRNFFSNRYMHYDRPYDGAPEFVQHIHQSGCEIVYLTGRDRPGTEEGTLRALRWYNFPMDTHCHLFMKPHKETPDLEFKKDVLKNLRARFRILALIDNEAENLNMYAKEVPEAEVVFFHSIMSPRIPNEAFHIAMKGRDPLKLNSYKL